MIVILNTQIMAVRCHVILKLQQVTCQLKWIKWNITTGTRHKKRLHYQKWHSKINFKLFWIKSDYPRILCLWITENEVSLLQQSVSVAVGFSLLLFCQISYNTDAIDGNLPTCQIQEKLITPRILKYHCQCNSYKQVLATWGQYVLQLIAQM